ncbi:BA75_02700T0 [Komagataella pastoris]|uniref:BA75_02700T0 n=1 Tax=Komagataella pastoris TaxID=4922 RepID=A0A1B2JDA8_PICPA|nr:BA75_02700T0 [Komagataella pastoris]
MPPKRKGSKKKPKAESGTKTNGRENLTSNASSILKKAKQANSSLSQLLQNSHPLLDNIDELNEHTRHSQRFEEDEGFVFKRLKKDPDDDVEYTETSRSMILPLNESPVKRNPKQKRRSSLSNRGKRVSSIGNGFTGTPHDDVEIKHFHKHLDESLPEPHRMRQLLIWTGKRLLKKKQTHKDNTIVNIAKVIKEELIRDLIDGKLNTSWWNRVDSDDEDEFDVTTFLPNQQNETNKKNLILLQRSLEQLKEEEKVWDEKLKQLTGTLTSSPDISSVDVSNNETCSKSQETVSKLERKAEEIGESLDIPLEKKLDLFADRTHKLRSIERTSRIFIDNKSKEIASLLSEKQEMKELPQDLLKAISRIDRS